MKVWFVELSVSEDLSSSVWLKTLMILFLNFADHFFVFMKCTQWIILVEKMNSQGVTWRISVSLIIQLMREKFKKGTWMRWKMVVLRNVSCTIIWGFPNSLKSPVEEDTKCSNLEIVFSNWRTSQFDCDLQVMKYTSLCGRYERCMSKHRVWVI